MSALSILVAENHINKFYKPILGWGNGGRRAHIGHIAPYMGNGHVLIISITKWC